MEGDVDGFCRFIGSKRKMRGNTGLLLNGAGDLWQGTCAWWGQGVKKMAPGSFRWCPGTRQESPGTNCNAGSFVEWLAENFSLWGWLTLKRFPREAVKGSVLGDTQTQAGNGAEQPAVADSALSRASDRVISSLGCCVILRGCCPSARALGELVGVIRYVGQVNYVGSLNPTSADCLSPRADLDFGSKEWKQRATGNSTSPTVCEINHSSLFIRQRERNLTEAGESCQAVSGVPLVRNTAEELRSGLVGWTERGKKVDSTFVQHLKTRL